MGVLLAVGFASRGRHTALRVAAALAVTLLLPTLYFTFSRGAWLALALGLACALLYDPQRLQLAAWLLVLAPAPALAAFTASRSDALTHTNVPLAHAVHDGHRLALALLILLPLTALCALAGIVIEKRFTPSRPTRLAFAGLLAAVPVVAVAVVLVHYGGPAGVASRAYDSFKSPPIELQPNPDSNLNKRLFSLTSNGRIDLWHVAWDDYVSHSALGSGAGTFARHWYKDRPAPFNAQDAHGAYIEALAELGPLGLVLLLVAVLVPLAAATRARDEPLAPFLLAAYVAFILHAGVDWDLEQTAIGLAGLTCGASLLVAAREPRGSRAWSPSFRGVGLALTVAVTGFVLFGLLGNSALATSNSARGDHNWAEAEKQADRARQLLPWSPQPWVALGSAESGQGRLPAARASFRRAVAQDPGDWTLWFGLAVITRGKERKAAIAQARLLNPRSNELNLLVSRSG
jgi:tetratricopeptide (TPR) repeat protein